MSQQHNNKNKESKPFEGGSLLYKLHIKGNITLLTGLHIGGSEVDLDIGGLDKEVAKINDNGVMKPYIPGSSLKGKMRALIGRMNNSKSTKTDTDFVKEFFGESGGEDPETKIYYPFVRGRAIFRDCYLITNEFVLENKSENTINRVNGGANPRNMERVSKDAVFELDIMIDVYANDINSSSETKYLSLLKTGLNLLTYDYLGGSGSRGYGKVKIDSLEERKISFDLETGKVNVQKKYKKFKLEANEIEIS